MERNQFTFYASFWRGLSRIKNKAVRCDAYDAIVRYALLEEEPDLDRLPDAAAMAFEMARPNLDASKAKAEAGMLGGRSKANQKQTESKRKQTESKRKQSESKDGVCLSDSEKQEQEQEQEQDKEQMLIPPISPTGGKKAPAKQEGFDQFWEAYPRKVGKSAARAAYAKIRVPVEQLLAALEQQKQSDQWSRDGGRYIPNAATWLNQGRWEDQLAPAGGKSNQYQRHGQDLSPMMKAAVAKMLEAEDHGE